MGFILDRDDLERVAREDAAADQRRADDARLRSRALPESLARRNEARMVPSQAQAAGQSAGIEIAKRLQLHNGGTSGCGAIFGELLTAWLAYAASRGEWAALAADYDRGDLFADCRRSFAIGALRAPGDFYQTIPGFARVRATLLK